MTTIPYLQPSTKQTDSSRLNGTAGKGLIRFNGDVICREVVVKADHPTGFEVFAIIPDPATSDLTGETEYKIGEIIATVSGRIKLDDFPVPKQGAIKITSTSSANPLAQLIYHVEHAR